MKVWKRDIKIKDLDAQEFFVENSNGMNISFLNFGGIVTSINVPDALGTFENVVLSYKNYDDYFENPGYFGALIGRTAGRIKGGAFTLNGKEYHLEKNYGSNSGHGGTFGFHRQLCDYRIVETKDRVEIKLLLHSPHMDGGYPGDLDIAVTYILTEDDVFRIEYEGVASEDTLINLTSHTYFNLSGSFEESIKYHELYIESDHVLELDETSAPTGELMKVQNTPFDFRYMREIGEEMDMNHPQLKMFGGYDHPFVLKRSSNVQARLAHRFTGRVMEITTDNAAVVLYTQNHTDDQIINGGSKLKVGRAVALEIQNLPIGYNECFKEYSMIKANDKYHTFTEYRFFVEPSGEMPFMNDIL